MRPRFTDATAVRKVRNVFAPMWKLGVGFRSNIVILFSPPFWYIGVKTSLDFLRRQTLLFILLPEFISLLQIINFAVFAAKPLVSIHCSD